MFNDSMGPFMTVQFAPAGVGQETRFPTLSTFLDGNKTSLNDLVNAGLFEPVKTRLCSSGGMGGVTVGSRDGLLYQGTQRAMRLSRLLTNDPTMFMINFRRAVKGTLSTLPLQFDFFFGLYYSSYLDIVKYIIHVHFVVD